MKLSTEQRAQRDALLAALDAAQDHLLHHARLYTRTMTGARDRLCAAWEDGAADRKAALQAFNAARDAAWKIHLVPALAQLQAATVPVQTFVRETGVALRAQFEALCERAPEAWPLSQDGGAAEAFVCHWETLHVETFTLACPAPLTEPMAPEDIDPRPWEGMSPNVAAEFRALPLGSAP